MSKMPKPKAGKSPADQFRGTLYSLAVFYFIIYLIGAFFEFLFRPLREAVTPEKSEEDIRELFARKQELRKRIRGIYHNDINDPIYQFHLRFIDDPESYKDDKDTAVYKEWFDEYRKGNIIDSELRWAPEAFSDSDTLMEKNFIDYMKIQWDLHKRDTAMARWKFCKVIRKYYPEFTPTMKGLEEDLACYEAETTESSLTSQLFYEIQEFGLPQRIAEYLTNSEITGEDLENKAIKCKRLLSQECTESACIYGIENDLPDDVINTISEVERKTEMPPKIGYAFAMDQISVEQLAKITVRMERMIESYGIDIFSEIEGKDVTPYDEFVEEYLKEFKEAYAIKRYCEKG